MADTKELRERLASLNKGKQEQIDPLVHRAGNTFKVKVKDLLNACDSNPEHPLAATFESSVQGLPDTQEVIVEREDLEALLDNMDVETYTTSEIDADRNKVLVERKRVVPRRKETSPAKPPPTQPPVPKPPHFAG